MIYTSRSSELELQPPTFVLREVTPPPPPFNLPNPLEILKNIQNALPKITWPTIRWPSINWPSSSVVNDAVEVAPVGVESVEVVPELPKLESGPILVRLPVTTRPPNTPHHKIGGDNVRTLSVKS